MSDAANTSASTDPKPLWGGRFSAAPSGELERFGASLLFDRRMWREDIAGSKAHAQMLARQGVISDEDAKAITAGLDDIAKLIEKGEFTFDVDRDEDIHMAIERVLTENIGEAGGRLHTGRSRNDQSALDLHLWCKRSANELVAALVDLEGAILEVANREMGVVMPGYTHLQPAQPVLYSHYLMAYFWMLTRDVTRAQAAAAAADVSPLGAAALAGTTYPLDRPSVASALGLSAATANSMDSVSDRDYVCDLTYACSMAQLHLSRLCEELVWWSSAEFAFIEMDDAHSTGSSIMPQKKNPDFAELVRGKTGRVVGDLMSLLTLIKGTPLTYDKDFQEDKEPVFDAVDTIIGSLHAVTGMVSTMTVHGERMREASHEGFMCATDLADYLVGRGLPFRQAHAVVGRVVGHCVEADCTLQELSLDELRSYSPLFEADVDQALDVDACVARRTTLGGTGHEAVAQQLEQAAKILDAHRAQLG